ncbi:MAG: hypothetical protein GC172_06285 [Phycisphaera sp.]|nr:hypothetical protein [Phycisphaera sp.]
MSFRVLPTPAALLATVALRVGSVAVASLLAILSARVAEASPFPSPSPEPSFAPSVEVLVDRPIAVRDAPILVPVRIAGAAPATVSVRAIAGDGSALGFEAQILWPRRPRVGEVEPLRWARASNELRLSRERQAGATDAYLALDPPRELPRVERFELGAVRIAPRWFEAANLDALDGLLARLARRASAFTPVGAPDAGLSLPDPAAPFERFRWEIGRALRGWAAPPAFEAGSPDDLAARATTALWLAALSRLASTSEGVAVECAEMLVATCRDDTAPAPIAAWIADPAALSSMLALALDASRTGETLVEAMLSWLRVRSSIQIWVEDETRDEVVLALANPTTSEEVVRLSWLDSVWLDVDDPPLAALAMPGEVTRVRVPRPRRAEIDGARIPQDDGRATLRIEHRGEVRMLVVTPPVVRAGLAGVVLSRFVAPLDLVSVSMGTSADAPTELAAVASLRPRLGSWEVFAEVRTGRAPTADDAIVLVGAGGTAITVRGNGAVDDPAGLVSADPNASGTLEFRAYADRFRVGFVLPPAWIDRIEGDAVVMLGLRRTGPEGVADAPFAAVPWRATPRLLGVDLLGGGARVGETLYSAP